MPLQALTVNDQFNKAYDLLDFEAMQKACDNMAKFSDHTALFLYNRMINIKA